MLNIDDSMLPLMLLYAAVFWFVQQPTVQTWVTGLVGSSVWSGTVGASALTQVGCALMAVAFAVVSYIAGMVFKIETSATIVMAAFLFFVVANPMVLAWFNTNVMAVTSSNVITANGAFIMAIVYLIVEWLFLRYNGGSYGAAPKRRGLLRGMMA